MQYFNEMHQLSSMTPFCFYVFDVLLELKFNIYKYIIYSGVVWQLKMTHYFPCRWKFLANEPMMHIISRVHILLMYTVFFLCCFTSCICYFNFFYLLFFTQYNHVNMYRKKEDGEKREIDGKKRSGVWMREIKWKLKQR